MMNTQELHVDVGFDAARYLYVHQLQNWKEQFSDTANGERLVRKYGDVIRYNPDWKKWLVWEGKRWKTDDGPLIHEKGLEVIRDMYELMNEAHSWREADEIERKVKQVESVRRRKAMIESASLKKEIEIKSQEVDTDPELLNVENGTVNLRTGVLQEHCKENMITKMAKVTYDPNADCPLWKQFIREIMGNNPDLITFLQVVAGWAVTGDTSEQCMFFLYGSGANGKSTFLNVLMKILGDYAMSSSTETFMKKNSEQISNDIARLRGARFVTTAEAEEGRRLSETLIKQITGNDSMTARFLYGEFFTFTPSFKIFMATNHKPSIRGTDHGIWRRIKLIPFTTTIPYEKMDRNLEEKLLSEASGILNWLIEGAMAWYEVGGLVEPLCISNATKEYKEEMDLFGAFLSDRCLQKPNAKVQVSKLSNAFAEWCEKNNERSCSGHFVSNRMKQMGFQQERNSKARYWVGIELIDTNSLGMDG
ncbi:MAG: DUF5906 domain-containing protein [Spirochaetaceae bacterium]|jgi:putative DNA primase/helicase|nr:DUF5906 domain-containing protein [Spirochaetaceae bacterium]